MDSVFILYLVFVLAGSLLLFIFLHFYFSKIVKIKKAAVENIQTFEAIQTETPLENPYKRSQTIAKNSISSRFTIFKRLTFLIFSLIIIIAISFPFLDNLPQAFISILVASGAIIIGMACKPFIENIISGIAITISKKLNIGDTILINGNYGSIEDISSTHTIVKLWDWRRHVIPNSLMINNEFINYSLHDTWLWAHVDFWVSYNEDLAKVKIIARDAVHASSSYKQQEEPSFWVMKTTKESVECWVAAWAESPQEAWQLKTDIRVNIISAFKKEGIKTHMVNYGKFTGL